MGTSFNCPVCGNELESLGRERSVELMSCSCNKIYRRRDGEHRLEVVYDDEVFLKGKRSLAD